MCVLSHLYVVHFAALKSPSFGACPSLICLYDALFVPGMQQDIVKLHDAVSRLGCNEDLPEDYIVTFSHDRLGES